MSGVNYIVMGAGAWGTAMAIHLSKCGHRVVLVPRDEAKAETIRQHNENIFHLPGVELPSAITFKVENKKLPVYWLCKNFVSLAVFYN